MNSSENLPLKCDIPPPEPLDLTTSPPLLGGAEVDLAFQLEPEAMLVQEAIQDGAPSLINNMEAEALWTGVIGGWLAALAPELPPPLRAPAYSLGLSLVDDATMATFNQAWRQQTGPTDVLAFAAREGAPPLPHPPTPADPLELGDIVISLETAARQASEAGQSLQQELLFLASHGLLHLLGWDHPDEESLAAMLQRQDDLLSSTFPLPDVPLDSCRGESPG